MFPVTQRGYAALLGMKEPSGADIADQAAKALSERLVGGGR